MHLKPQLDAKCECRKKYTNSSQKKRKKERKKEKERKEKKEKKKKKPDLEEVSVDKVARYQN